MADEFERATQDYGKPIAEDDFSDYVGNFTWNQLDREETSHYDMGRRAGRQEAAKGALEIVREKMAETIQVTGGKVGFQYNHQAVLAAVVEELQRIADSR